MSKDNVIYGIDHIINILKDLKETITDENAHQIELEANTKLDREPIWSTYHISSDIGEITCKTLSITITDRRRRL